MVVAERPPRRPAQLTFRSLPVEDRRYFDDFSFDRRLHPDDLLAFGGAGGRDVEAGAEF